MNCLTTSWKGDFLERRSCYFVWYAISSPENSGDGRGLALLVTVRDVWKKLGEDKNLWINGRKFNSTERNSMLWTIIVILVVLWLLGLLGHVGGSLIHLLLVVAVIVLIINLVQGRRGP
jgi:Family of unknown function (DUF5670)